MDTVEASETYANNASQQFDVLCKQLNLPDDLRNDFQKYINIINRNHEFLTIPNPVDDQQKYDPAVSEFVTSKRGINTLQG